MSKHLKFYLSAILAGLIIGILSGWTIITYKINNSFTVSGSWLYSPYLGAKDADPKTRSIIARTGVFALNKKEALYFIAETDYSGEPLNQNCGYEIKVKNLPGRWWSITAYNNDYFLISNLYKKYSVTSANFNGTYLITVGPTDQMILTNPNEGEFSLALRIYNPQADIEIASINLPEIYLTGCTT